MSGLGLSPLGTSPAGIGSQVANGPLYQSTAWQKSTTGAVSSVQIDPRTRDVVHDAQGSEQGMSDAAQRVWMLCQTTQGSRANWPKDGFARPESIGGDFARLTEDAFRNALAPMILDGTITIDSFTIEIDPATPTRGYALVTWTDRRTNRQEPTRTPLQF